ncbi:MAG: non-ribosomal peptide synthetase, partial [bacterium]|nr:non-ribosomal peptide synthetase [bacterium]
LVRLWSEILDLDKGVIGVHDNFFHLGGHSLIAVGLASRIHKELNVKPPLTQIFKTPTIRGLAQFIDASATDTFDSLEAVEKREYYPLSSAQKRLFILQQMAPESTAYNIPGIIPLPDEIAVETLENIFCTLIERHESFRTSFHMRHDAPVQEIRRNVPFEIRRHPPASSPAAVSRDLFVRPFDLSRAPLLRVGVIEIPGGRKLLTVDVHHIISDGISSAILRKEFMALLDRKQLPPLAIQYKDFAHWQNSPCQEANRKKQETWWLNRFPDELPLLDLPLDYTRPAVQRFKGETLSFLLAPQSVDRLKSLALSSESTLYMVVLAVVYVLLSKLSGREDIIIGTPVAGRRHADLEKIVGMFVNTLALRHYPAGEKTFETFLHEVRMGTMAALENQDYQFEDLIEALSVPRDAGRNPVFDVTFNHQIKETGPDHPHALYTEVETSKRKNDYNYENTASKFDMTFGLLESDERCLFYLRYNTALFKKESVRRFTRYFE